MKFSTYSHQGGLEALPPAERADIESALKLASVPIAKGAASAIRKAVLESLVATGWSGEYAVSRGSEITITSAKNHVGLCLQTGNMSRMYADLLKLKKLHAEGAISSAAMLVPASTCAQTLGSNVANADRLTKELHIFEKVIDMPIALFAFH